MNPVDAMRHMLDASCMSPYKASLAMGKKHSYMTSALTRKGRTSAALLADLAHVCGYRLQLVGRGETIDIDGTRRETDDAGEG